ncbi:hypothetical protein CAPTEDRAFT_175615 [Capitella teleta]|uniref:Dynactin subunit 4 n=1 Tax=Capitella teleta TaxID=283909 RepID=R7VEK2_CAPTE|nr:hypothetical protein CAPTEDRAFT_175615 [Capitella teleta]|eukprot:ELU17017.1 hypothetical protein CAPTEDRAFT_175615 [Capitella teleta]
MATFVTEDRVLYAASSGAKAPLCRLYFCRHCLKIRSTNCVSHEVDSLYCPNCLENMPTNEASLKKYRCSNCFDCPTCCHTLSTRATTIPMPDRDQPGKIVPKKVYYLACGFCRWTSRDVGMKDQLVAGGGWQNQENPHDKRIFYLLDHFRQLAAKEKAEKEKKKYIRRRSHLHLSDKFGLSSVAARRRSGLLSVGSPSMKESEDVKIQDIEPNIASEDVDDQLDDSIFTQELDLSKVTNIKQRHANPDVQPMKTTDLYPKHKHLLIKCSQRCRECEHNLSKPDYNPHSIKFKIQLVALHHVPDLKMMSFPSLILNKESQVVLIVLNPLDTLVHMTLLPLEKEKDDWSTAKIVIPSCELLLSPRDDAADFDENTDQKQAFKDNTSVVVFRKANRLAFLIKVIPQSQDEEVKVAFQMKYDYRNLASALQQTEGKEPEMVWLQHSVFLNLGRLTPQS